ncbi:hypothetical protein ACS0TY_023312 [Phlomoides rotata]
MRLSLKPLKRASATLRRLSAVAHLAPPSPPPPDQSSPIPETLSLLQSTDPSSWLTNVDLNPLLSSLSPPSVLKITRELPNYENAFQLFNCLKTIPQLSDSTPLASQAVLEHAMRENPECAGKLYELFALSQEQNIPLSVNSGTLLIKCFGRAKMLDEMMMVLDAIDEEIKNTDVLNLAVSGLLEWGRVDDAFKLLDEMLAPDALYHPNSNTSAITFSYILNRNWSGRNLRDEEIYNLVLRFGEHDLFPSGFRLTQIIMRFCREGKSEYAWTVLREAMNLGSDVEIASCNSLLTSLGQNKDVARMNLLMDEMKEKGIKPNIVTYGIMIKQLCRFRRLDEALEVLEKMRDGELGVKPDVIIYNTIINGLCRVGRQEEGFKLMEKMRLESNCRPNTVTYNCLIDGFCKMGEIEKGHELFDQMSREGVELNVVSLNALLDGMCKNGRVSSAMDLFGSMREKGLQGNIVSYTILITAFCAVGNIDKAMKLFDEMRETGCCADAIVYYSLISGLSRAERMDDASYIMLKMKEAGFSLDIVCYNTMIGGFCKRNKVDKAAEMLKDMEKDGLKPDRVTYNTLLSHFCSKGDFTHARSVMKEMRRDGLKPNVVTYGALIQGYCSHDNLDEAMKLFGEMGLSSKAPPNTPIYNILIDAHCKNDDVEGALSLMDDMKTKGVRSSSTTYNALFKGLQQRHWLEKALEFMDQMTEQECDPDYTTMEILTEWLSAVGEMEKLRKFVKGLSGFCFDDDC